MWEMPCSFCTGSVWSMLAISIKATCAAMKHMLLMCSSGLEVLRRPLSEFYGAEVWVVHLLVEQISDVGRDAQAEDHSWKTTGPHPPELVLL